MEQLFTSVDIGNLNELCCRDFIDFMYHENCALTLFRNENKLFLSFMNFFAESLTGFLCSMRDQTSFTSCNDDVKKKDESNSNLLHASVLRNVKLNVNIRLVIEQQIETTKRKFISDSPKLTLKQWFTSILKH